MTSNEPIFLFFVLMGLLIVVGVCQSKADSIIAEEIEVPPPTWSIFYEGEPEPEPLLIEAPPEIEDPFVDPPPPDTTADATALPPTSGGVPPAVIGTGIAGGIVALCFIFDLCGDGDNDGDGNNPPPISPPGSPQVPTAPVPEPGAFLVFGLGLLLLSRRGN